MSASQETPGEPSGRLYSAKKLIRAGWKLWVLGATWLLGLSAWLALVGDWSPWLSEHLPKPYRLAAMIWALLSPQWSFAIAAVVLGAFSFEDYHRDRTHQKSITPWFLLGCAFISATLAVVSWTPSIERGSVESQNQQRLNEALDKQSAAIEILTKKLAFTQRQFSTQVDIMSLSVDVEAIYATLESYDQRMEAFNARCMSLVTAQVHSMRPSMVDLTYETVIKDIAIRTHVSVPDFEDLSGFDLNRPAPGQDQMPTEESKYLFGHGYWKCRAQAAIIAKFKQTLLARLNDASSSRAQAQSALGALPR